MSDNRSAGSSKAGETTNNDTEPDVDQLPTAGEVESSLQSDGEYGGPKGLEPTRYGDWEKSGRCIDF